MSVLNRPMKVLHVLPSMSLSAGGPPVVVTNIARALKHLGAEPSVFTTTAYHSDRQNTLIMDPPSGIAGIDVRVFPVGIAARFAYSQTLGRSLQSHAGAYDVIHIHSLFQHPQYAAFRAATSASIPYVVSPHGALDPYLRTRGKFRKWAVDRVWQRSMLDKAHAIHYTTQEEEGLVDDLAFQAPTAVIPNGVDVHAFGNSPSGAVIDAIRTELKVGDGPLIVNHGRLDRKKGLVILIEAMTRITMAFPSAQLVLVGPDSRGHRKELELCVSTKGLNDAVIFAGLRRDQELQALVHTADVWALPSYTENFGYAVVEAMAAGKPVVTSPHVNIAPNASDAHALVMVDNTPELVATAVIDQLQNREARHDLGMRAQAYAQQFDWLTVGRQYLDLYTSVVEQHRRQGE